MIIYHPRAIYQYIIIFLLLVFLFVDYLLPLLLLLFCWSFVDYPVAFISLFGVSNTPHLEMAGR